MNRQQADIVVVGAGFSGLYALHKLRSLGFSVQGFETAGDVGGTWFWNRYPGARCDVESMDYSYSFDVELEQDWNWTERFATQPEILRYLNHVADRFDLRPLIRFNTRIDSASWSADRARWTVRTQDGLDWEARYLILATGSLSAAKPPDIPGLDDFDGDVYFTSHWPAEAPDFSGRRVGVVGTGSSGIQAIPMLAEQAAHLTVFQRTPTFSLPARNAPLPESYVGEFKRNYRAHRKAMRDTVVGVRYRASGKRALSIDENERQTLFQEVWDEGGPGLVNIFSDLLFDRAANDTAADFVRQKIKSIVKDPAVADCLSPRDYPIGTKRVAVDTDYYATFNRPNVTLKDLRTSRLERIVSNGVMLSTGLVELDALVMATGFDALTGSFLRIDIHGVDGHSLRDKWHAGPRTFLGLMSAGFPNLFFIAGPGSPSVLSNMVLSGEQHVEWLADCLVAMRDGGFDTIEASIEAEDRWVDGVNAAAARTLYMSGNSWYLGANVPDKPRVFMPFIGGVAEYRRICDGVAASGYAGFLRRRSP